MPLDAMKAEIAALRAKRALRNGLSSIATPAYVPTRRLRADYEKRAMERSNPRANRILSPGEVCNCEDKPCCGCYGENPAAHFSY